MRIDPGLATLALVTTAVAHAEPATVAEPLYEILLDMDGDGTIDRAVLVLNGPGRTDFGPLTSERYGLGNGKSVDLAIYLGAGDAKADIATAPTFLKKAIVDPERTNWVQPLESNARGSLVTTFVYGWGASQSWGEGLTIVVRDGEFLVGGYSRDWDWNSLLADGEFETLMGGCDINYLTGKAVLTKDPNETRPMPGTYRPVRLADWSYAMVPEACDF